MVKKFEPGKTYFCLLKKRPPYFNHEGKMDWMIGNIVKVLDINYTKREGASVKTRDGKEWYIKYDDFTEAKWDEVLK